MRTYGPQWQKLPDFATNPYYSFSFNHRDPKLRTSVALQYLLQRYPLTWQRRYGIKTGDDYARIEPCQLIPESRTGLPTDCSITYDEITNFRNFRYSHRVVDATTEGLTWFHVNEFNVDDVMSTINKFLESEPQRLQQGYGHANIRSIFFWDLIRQLQNHSNSQKNNTHYRLILYFWEEYD